MRNSTRTKLSVTTLESREVPAAFAFGDGWANADSLTLSFAPDGTEIGRVPEALLGVDTLTVPLLDLLGLGVLNGTTNGLLYALGGGSSDESNTFSKWNSLGQSQWQREILRAFQSWAAVTNLNVGLTADNGSDFGKAGDLQADSRFGDIRIGGMKLSSGALGTAVQASDANGTWSGDVLFNTSIKFRTSTTGDANAYDLFTTAAHEAGHVFGLHHSDDATSVMSERYVTRRTGLAASDVATIQSYYGGARQPDGFDAASGNDTAATASVITGAGNRALVGDLTTNGDVDHYTFTVPTGWSGFTAKLRTAGLSLLTAKLSVLNAAGQVVDSDVSTNPTNGDLSVRVNGATAGGTYTLRVEGATGDVFDIGRYQISLSSNGSSAPPPKAFTADGGTDNSAATAVASATPFAYAGRVEGALDSDHYRLTSAAGSGITVTFRRMNPNDTALRIAAFDSSNTALAMEVVSDDGDTLTARVPATADGVHVLRVSAAGVPGGSGYYYVGAVPTSGHSAQDDAVANGTLTRGRPSVAYSMELVNSGLVRYTLDSFASTAGTGVFVNLAVIDSTGKTVLTARQEANQDAVTVSGYLAAGKYTLKLSVTFPLLSSTSSIQFSLFGGQQSDPIGTYASSSGNTPYSGSGGSSGGGSSGGSSGTATVGAPPKSSTKGSAYTY